VSGIEERKVSQGNEVNPQCVELEELKRSFALALQEVDLAHISECKTQPQNVRRGLSIDRIGGRAEALSLYYAKNSDSEGLLEVLSTIYVQLSECALPVVEHILLDTGVYQVNQFRSLREGAEMARYLKQLVEEEWYGNLIVEEVSFNAIKAVNSAQEALHVARDRVQDESSFATLVATILYSR